MAGKRRSFTLIELLVVMAVIAALVAILFPTLSRVREKARQSRCTHNLHQIAIALRAYWNDYRAYPPPPNYNAGTGGLYALYAEGYINSKEVFHCPNDRRTENLPHGYSSYNWHYNFYGYYYNPQNPSDPNNGKPFLDNSYYNNYDPNGDGISTPSERRQFPGLINRYAPEYTIVTHCTFHREFYGDQPGGQRDLILRLSGDVKSLVWTQVNWGDQRE